MIAPDPARRSNPQTSRLILLRNNLLAAALIFIGLEIWNPCFFLMDDNLDGGMPFLTEVGRHLLNGESPFFTQHLFGGNYNLLRDATYFIWHPVYLVASLLGGTPYFYLIMDVCAFVFLMISVAGFTNLAWYLRQLSETAWSDGWIMFFTLSFNFSMMALASGSSWLNYMVNNGALPWLALGILLKDLRAGFGLIALVSLHQILGGHPLALIANGIFLSLFAIGIGLQRRSFGPLIAWGGGNLLAIFFALPFLLPMLHGFADTQRAMGVSVDNMGESNIPAGLFMVSLLFGMGLWTIFPAIPHLAFYKLALASCAGAWLIFPALLSRAKWTGLQVITLTLVLFGVIMVIRPEWISEIMIHLPVIRSMRWPFRELVQFLFFFHLFLLLRPSRLGAVGQRLLAAASTLAVVIPMLLYPVAPAFADMPRGRQMIFTGEFERYWAQVRTFLQPGDRIAVLIPYDLYKDPFERPHGLLGSYNYAMIAGITNTSGYSHTVPTNQLYTKTIPSLPNGSYEIRQKADLVAERPELKFITLESLHPVKITLSSQNGPTIDLTPYIPERFRNPQ